MCHIPPGCALLVAGSDNLSDQIENRSEILERDILEIPPLGGDVAGKILFGQSYICIVIYAPDICVQYLGIFAF